MKLTWKLICALLYTDVALPTLLLWLWIALLLLVTSRLVKLLMQLIALVVTVTLAAGASNCETVTLKATPATLMVARVEQFAT